MQRLRVADGWLRRWRPNAVLATGERAVWIAAALSLSRRVPWVDVGHGSEFGMLPGWERAVTRWAFGRATAVVCVSEFTRRQMHARGITGQRESVIPNGADPERFGLIPQSEIVRFRLRERLTGPCLITVGQVTDRKGQDIVIRALPHVLAKVPDASYLIAGLPTRVAEFSSIAQRLGVAERVRFLGRTDQELLPQYLNAADVFVMTSRQTTSGDVEGYGIAVVEAALCGKPAVVTAGSGLAEAIVDGVTGITVPEDDEVATAGAITALLTDSTLRLRMGSAARQRAIRVQTWEQKAAEYDALLRGLIDDRARSLRQSA
jgi:phosphatidylinositol alpha-1,6-mannosyltransferase